MRFHLWRHGKRVSALALSVLLVWHWEPSPKYEYCGDENRWKTANFSAIMSDEIVEYSSWRCNYACSFHQGKTQATAQSEPYQSKSPDTTDDSSRILSSLSVFGSKI